MSPVPANPNQLGSSSVPPRPLDPPHWQPPTRIVLERPSRWPGRLGWIAFIIALFVIAAMYSSYNRYFQSGGIEEHYHSLSKSAADKVAIVDIEGVIMHNEGFAKWQIDQIRN